MSNRVANRADRADRLTDRQGCRQGRQGRQGQQGCRQGRQADRIADKADRVADSADRVADRADKADRPAGMPTGRQGPTRLGLVVPTRPRLGAVALMRSNSAEQNMVRPYRPDQFRPSGAERSD